MVKLLNVIIYISLVILSLFTIDKIINGLEVANGFLQAVIWLLYASGLITIYNYLKHSVSGYNGLLRKVYESFFILLQGIFMSAIVVFPVLIGASLLSLFFSVISLKSSFETNSVIVFLLLLVFTLNYLIYNELIEARKKLNSYDVLNKNYDSLVHNYNELTKKLINIENRKNSIQNRYKQVT